ncbi:hypothetical protein Tco_0231802 [Tanacetum coccineum]
MDPNSSLEKMCLGDNVIEISSDKIKGLGDWNSPKYQDTAGSKGKKVMNALSFYRMETDEISERYIAPCFVNGLEAYDGEVNLAFDENLISNEFAFVNFIINLAEYDFDPGVILGRSFLRLAKGVVDFGNGVITIYPEPDPFEDDSKKTGKSSEDWDQLLDFNFDDVPKFREELPPFKDKVELDGKTVKEDEEAVKRIKDTGLDINTMPYRIFEMLGREDMKKLDRGITMINHTQAEAMGKLSNVLCQVGEVRRTSEKCAALSTSECNRILWEQTMMRPDHDDPNAQDMKPWKRNCFHKFTMSFCYGKDVTEMQSLAFNINDPIYAKLCHEFYSTYEFDEVCADDELQTKKIIKFRLGGHAHSFTLLEFARRLGLYQAVELEEDGFNVYFKGGLRNDDNFNAQDYWLRISREDNLGLSMSHTFTIRNPILRVIHKMITYGLCQRTTGLGDCEMDEEERSWDSERESNLMWDFDTTTLRDLIDSDGKLIPEDPQPGVPRVGIPRPPSASMQDLYHRVFEHMAKVYSVPIQGAYNLPGYAQPQYDQYYQQYPPPPPQYQPPWQQRDDDE